MMELDQDGRREIAEETQLMETVSKEFRLNNLPLLPTEVGSKRNITSTTSNLLSEPLPVIEDLKRTTAGKLNRSELHQQDVQAENTSSIKSNLPSELLRVIEDLKRTATGKRQRSELRQEDVEAVKSKLTDNIQTVTEFGSFEHKAVAIILQEIDVIAQEVNKGDLKTYADHATEQYFVESFCRIWNTLDRFKDKDTMDITQLIIKILLLNITMAFSDVSSDFCCRFGDAGALMSLFNELNLPTLSVSAVNQSGSKLEWDSPREYVKRILVIMYNVVKNKEQHRILFRDANVSPILENYLKCDFMLIRAKALFVLSYIVNEDEHDNIKTSGENIKYFVRILKDAMGSNTHYSARYTFSVVDVLGAIIRLATLDKNKEHFVENEILPLLEELLTSDDSNPTELHSVALIIWTLSFSEKNRLIISSSNNCISALLNLTRRTSDPELKSACLGALWEIDKAKLSKRHQDNTRSNDEDTPHVMLSYQWDVKELILQVKDQLEQAGFKVWIDTEKMAGSTLDAMAKAVEDAAVVLICYTELYKNSSSCRTEAEYAYKLKKDIVPLKLQHGYRPDGWLGILLGTKLWFDMSDADRLRQNVGSLIKELDSRGRVDVKHIGLHTLPPTNFSIRPLVKQNEKLKESSVKQRMVVTWDTSDVFRWLENHGLSQYRTWFDKYDGKILLGLKSMANDAPDFFFRSLKKRLHIKSLVDMIKLKQALEELS